MADVVERKIGVGVYANTKEAEKKIDKLNDKSVNISVGADIENVIKSINEALQHMRNSFKGEVKFSGIQKGLDDVIAKINSVTKVFNANTPKEINAINVNLVGLKKLQDATDAIQRNVELLNDSKIDLNTFERLASVLENIETLVNSIVKGMNFDSIRPSTQVQKDIDSTTDKLKDLEKQEKKILELEDYLGKSGISKGKQIIDWGDSEDIKAIDNLIKKIREYISLGGDLSKFQFKIVNPDTNIKELRSLQDVFDILRDEGKIDIIDSSKISNDVVEVKALRNELLNLNRELDEAIARENRDLNVSLDTKSVEDFASAIQTAVQNIGQLNISIPEGFTFDGLSTENLDKIVAKLDEIKTSISRIGDLLSTGVDTSKMQEDISDIEVNVHPKISPRDFVMNVEDQLYNESVYVSVSPMVGSKEHFINSIEKQLSDYGRKVQVDVNPNISVDYNKEQAITSETGETLKWYRGVKDVKSGFVTDKEDGTFWTTNIELAREYAGELGKVYESELKMKNVLEIDVSGNSSELFEYLGNQSDEASIKITELSRDIGKKEADISNYEDELESLQTRLKSFENMPGMDAMASVIKSQIDSTIASINLLENELEQLQDEYDKISDDISNPYGMVGTHDISSWAKKNGYDGVIFNNIKTSVDGTTEALGNSAVIYAYSQLENLKTVTEQIEDNINKTDIADPILNKENDLKEMFSRISNNFGDGLVDKINDFKKSLEDSTDLNYDVLFDKLRTTLLQIVEEFQRSLNNVDFSVPNFDDIYNKLKSWNDSGSINDGLNTEKQVVDEVVNHEKSKLSELVGYVNSITDAVGRKTEAFRNEKTEVDSVVDQEKIKLQELSSVLDEIANKVKSISDLEIKVTDGLSAGNDSGQGSDGKKSSGGRKPKVTNPSQKGFKAPDGWVKDVDQAWDAALLENEQKRINETANAYEDLTGKLKKYYDLKNKELKGNLNKDESDLLDELNAEIQKAISGQGKYANATEEAAIAQKKFNDALKDRNKNSTNTYLNDIDNLYKNKSSVSDTKMPEYNNILAEINNKIELLRSKTPIDFTDDSQLEDFKKARNEIDKLFNDLNSKSLDKATTTEVDTVLKNINKRLNQSSAMPRELKDQLKALRTEIELLSNSASGIDKIKLGNFKAQLASIEAQIEKTGRTGLSFIDKVKRKGKDLFAYFATYVSIQDAIQVLRQGFETIKEYDTALTEMNKVSDESISTLKSFQKESFNLADSVGTTAKQIQNSTADWMRLGESLEEAKKSAQDANILYNVSEFETIDAATESLVSMSQAFNELEKREIIDVVNNLGNNFAISTDGLATALQNSASALQTAKNDFFEAAALTTAANTVVQDPDKVGAGLRTIALRLTGTEAARKELEELGEDVSDFTVTTTSKLNQQIIDLTKTQDGFGVSLLDMNGNYRSTYDILLDIANVWEQIAKEDLETGENRQNALLEMMAGKNRSNILASILQSPEVLKEAYDAALDSEGSAMRENEAYLESIEAHLSQLKNAWDALWINENNREVITFFLDLAKSVLDAVNNFGVLKTLLFGGGGIFAAIQTFKGNGRHKRCALFLCH